MSDHSFTIGGQKFNEHDLCEPGVRVNPAAIADGLFYEVAVGVNGEVRHLPLFTRKGLDVIGDRLAEEGNPPPCDAA